MPDLDRDCWDRRSLTTSSLDSVEANVIADMTAMSIHNATRLRERAMLGMGMGREGFSF